MAVIRRHYQFYGMVQGVGFRYRANYAAKAVGVTGWVTNCYDGSVEMEVQGSREQIREMLVMIESGSFIHIDDVNYKDIPVILESSFDIR